MKPKASCCKQLYHYLILPEDKDQTGMADIAAYRLIIVAGNYSITYIIDFDFYRISDTIRIMYCYYIINDPQ